MKPVFGKSNHIPALGQYGDCFSSCIASITEEDNVPNFADYPDDLPADKMFDDANEWLKERGLWLFNVGFRDNTLEQVLEAMGVWNPDIHYILGGACANGVNHTVVCKGGEVVHNPFPAYDIVGPETDVEPGHGWYYVWAICKP